MQPDLVTQADNGLMALAREIARRLHLPTTLVKFLIVGGIGYLINQAVLFLCYDTSVVWFLPAKDKNLLFIPDARLFIASVTAVEAAILTQFNLHERWTFRHRRRKDWIGVRFVKFNLSSAVSPIISVTTVNVLTPVFGLSPYISLTIGVLLGVSWNWFLNTLVIWPQHRATAE